jgi:sigma-54 dependent transcriptional regulator, acetoin dehydrogenase operon transcriptional activator AcoR
MAPPLLPHAPPCDQHAQRQVERRWQQAVAAGTPADGVRGVVRDSWARSFSARVRPDLPGAPLVWPEDDLAAARERTGWLETALAAVDGRRGAYAAGGHVLTLFDADGRMLHAEGDARALDALEAINFRPGALWSEAVVGTNGPGTALATGGAVHIVGAEHFCEGWQGWHCAAVPVRDRVTGRVVGVVDVSGRREGAHPHALALVVALAAAVEERLVSREMEARVAVLRRFAELTARWPGDALVAVDRAGTVLGASRGAPAELHPLAPAAEALRHALAEAVAAADGDLPREVRLPFAPAARIVAHPVVDGGAPVGAVLVIAAASGAAAPAPRRPAPGAGTRYSLHDLIGETPALDEAHRLAVAAAANALPVLLLGESGTGKEMFAQGIHAASARSARPFVAVNCGAIPSELVESELFGYVGGAFSGARRDGSAGKFEAADGGTLFLDEVGDLPLAAQAALLRVLQEGEVTRVGATRSLPVDVRVIAATHRDVDASLRDGSLREDLYYRLGVLAIELPPLRERRDDVRRLAERFLAAAGAELGRTGHAYAPEVLDAFRAYPWPGNVRELRNVVWRAVALATSPIITLADLPAAVRGALEPAVAAAVAAAPGADAAAPGADPAWARERERLVRAVERAGSMAEAAAILGIGRSTLYRQLGRYGLQPRRVVGGD